MVVVGVGGVMTMMGLAVVEGEEEEERGGAVGR